MNLEGSCLQVRLQLPPETTLLDLDVEISASELWQINFCGLNHTDYSSMLKQSKQTNTLRNTM